MRGLEARQRGEDAEAQELLGCSRRALERVTGSPAQLDAFQAPEPIASQARFAYWSAVSVVSREPYVVQTLADPDAPMLTPLFAMNGETLSRFAQHGDDLVLRGADTLLLYRGRKGPPARLSGDEALFTPDGRRLLTFGADQLEVVDVATLKQRPIHTGSEVLPQGEFLEKGRVFVSVTGGTACNSDAKSGLTLVDLEAATVRLQAAGDVSELSPSKRHAAVVTSELVGSGMHRILRIWDLGALATAPVRADLGAWSETPTAIQFDAAEQSVIVSDCGVAGAGHFEGFVTRASVDLHTGTQRAAPPKAAIPPRDMTERWQQLEGSFARLARPQELVVTERGPGRFKSYAETADGSLVALLLGDVTASEVQNVSQPALLLIDARNAKLQHSLKLPAADGRAPFTGGLLEFSPTGSSLLVCLQGGETVSTLVNLASQTVKVIDIPRSSCDWTFSAEGTALLAPGAAWDISGARAYRLPFAAADDATVADWFKSSAPRSEPAPPWLVCRAGAVLAPHEVCSHDTATGSTIR